MVDGEVDPGTGVPLDDEVDPGTGVPLDDIVDPGTGVPLDEVLVDVVVIGELPAELTLVSVVEPTGVEESDL